MVFNSKEDSCAIEILEVLSKGKNKYMKIYSELDFYFNTYQKAIEFLIKKELVSREELGYKKVDYFITGKGVRFLELGLLVREMVC